jgi:hypothetical protein
MKPIIEVTLEKGKTRRFTKKFKYEKTADESEIKFHVQDVRTSTELGRGQ